MSLKPRLGVPRELIRPFISPTVTAFVAFALMGFFSAVTPSIMGQTLRVKDHLIDGAVVLAFFGAGVVTLLLTAALSPAAAMLSGAVLLIPAAGLLAAAQGFGSSLLLGLATAVGGAAAALGYRGSLQVVNQMAPDDRRAELVSTFFIACYVGVSVPVVGVGAMTQVAGLTLAASVFAAVLCVMGLGALVAGVKYPPKT